MSNFVLFGPFSKANAFVWRNKTKLELVVVCYFSTWSSAELQKMALRRGSSADFKGIDSSSLRSSLHSVSGTSANSLSGLIEVLEASRRGSSAGREGATGTGMLFQYLVMPNHVHH